MRQAILVYLQHMIPPLNMAFADCILHNFMCWPSHLLSVNCKNELYVMKPTSFCLSLPISFIMWLPVFQCFERMKIISEYSLSPVFKFCKLQFSFSKRQKLQFNPQQNCPFQDTETTGQGRGVEPAPFYKVHVIFFLQFPPSFCYSTVSLTVCLCPEPPPLHLTRSVVLLPQSMPHYALFKDSGLWDLAQVHFFFLSLVGRMKSSGGPDVAHRPQLGYS